MKEMFATSLSEETKLLASYSTYKALYEDKKTAYDIVAAFINESIAISKKGVIYSLDELRELVKSEFGIDIPTVVIATAAKKVDCLKKEGVEYRVLIEKEKSEAKFNQYLEKSVDEAHVVFAEFRFFAKENGIEYDDADIDRAFMNFLLDEGSVNERLKILIGTFIIKRSFENPKIKETVNSIRRGHCLLTGLSNNATIDQTNSWNGKLTIYLDTEILFNIAGYNGEVWEIIAKDFLNVIKQANNAKQLITLKYFESTKEEIEDYFYSTKMSMHHHDVAYPIGTAMKHLLKKCRRESDLIEEQDLFFAKLSHCGIQEDKEQVYKNKEYDPYNLEDIETSQKYYSNNQGYTPDKEIDEAQKRITEIDEIVKKINNAREKERIVRNICNVVMTTTLILCIILLWIVVFYFGWDKIEKFTYLLPVTGTILGLIWRTVLRKKVIGYDVVLEKITSFFIRRYKEFIHEDIEALDQEKKELLKRMEI